MGVPRDRGRLAKTMSTKGQAVVDTQLLNRVLIVPFQKMWLQKTAPTDGVVGRIFKGYVEEGKGWGVSGMCACRVKSNVGYLQSHGNSVCEQESVWV